MHRIVCTLAAAFSVLVTAQAHAAYPDHPIKIVVPFPPGGGTDAVARVLAQKLGDKLGQTVIVENRPGAATVIGAQAVARAAPDGYTLMISGSSTYSVLPALKKDLPYKPLASFEQIGIVALAPSVLVGKPDLAATSLADLVSLAKAQSSKGGVTYGTFGAGSAPHLAGEMFAQTIGATMLAVPYKGSAQLTTALIGGELDWAVDTVASAAPHVNAGRMKAFAVSGDHRMPQLPNVPTLKEAGLPASAGLVGWYGFVAPASTPAPIIDTIRKATEDVMQDADVRKVFTTNGFEPVMLGRDAFRDKVNAEIAQFTAVAQRGAITMD